MLELWAGEQPQAGTGFQCKPECPPQKLVRLPKNHHHHHQIEIKCVWSVLKHILGTPWVRLLFVLISHWQKLCHQMELSLPRVKMWEQRGEIRLSSPKDVFSFALVSGFDSRLLQEALAHARADMRDYAHRIWLSPFSHLKQGQNIPFVLNNLAFKEEKTLCLPPVKHWIYLRKK